MDDYIITDEIRTQILELRDWGQLNMFDCVGIQREAFNRDFFELVLLIEENRRAYVNFIMHGERGKRCETME